MASCFASRNEAPSMATGIRPGATAARRRSLGAFPDRDVWARRFPVDSDEEALPEQPRGDGTLALWAMRLDHQRPHVRRQRHAAESELAPLNVNDEHRRQVSRQK